MDCKTKELGLIKCKENGLKFVNISLLKSDSPNFFEAEQIPIRPNSDAALILSLTHILIKENLYKQRFC